MSSQEQGACGGGRCCSFAEWQRAWGPGATVRKEVVVLGNGAFPTVVEECGLAVGLRVFSRGVSDSCGGARICALFVTTEPLPAVASCHCRTVRLREVAAAAATGSAAEIFL
jgi:hypothetical protein